ncbi:MAG TPA: glycosyltransferase, partial [Burkholderiales bacterium]|nr:glycosyltransferase [Burkholderiales bacterium]
GVDAVAQEHFLVANTYKDYSAAVLRILEHRQERDRLAHAGRERVLRHHAWTYSMRRLDAVIDRCLVKYRSSTSDAPASRAGSPLATDSLN